MMHKRIITLLLVFSIIVGLWPIMSIATPSGYTLKEIEICFNGATDRYEVLVDSYGNIFAPIEWLNDFGLYKRWEHTDHYEFYYVGQEEPNAFTKRIFIYKNTREYAIKVYEGKNFFEIIETWGEKHIQDMIKEYGLTDEVKEYINKTYPGEYEAWEKKHYDTKNGYKEIYSNKFSKTVNYEFDKKKNELWVPMEQLLPLLGAHVNVFDGAVQIKTVTVSFWQAFYNNLASIVFDSDEDMFGEDITTPLNYVTSTIKDFRVDRVVSYDNSGDVNDYETLFKIYLMDNENYLKSFDGERDLRKERLDDMIEASGSSLNAYEALYDVAKGTKQTQEFLKSNFSFADSGDSGKLAFALEAVGKIYDYTYIHKNLIKDHREMLGTMYHKFVAMAEGKERTKRIGCPSYRAAMNIHKRYGEDAERYENILTKSMDDLGYKLLGEVVKNLSPSAKAASIASDIMSFFDSAASAEISRGALVYKEDRICSTAYSCYTDSLMDVYYSKSHIEEIRLLGLMTLISSRNAYLAHAPSNPNLKKIDKMLEDFYLSAESVGFEDSEYIKNTASTIKKKYGDLPLYSVKNNSTSNHGTNTPVQETQEPKPTKKPVTKPTATPTTQIKPTATPKPETNWEELFADELRIAAQMAGQSYVDVDEMEFNLDAFLKTGTEPEYFKREIACYDEYVGALYRYYYKKSEVDKWSLKYFGVIFDDEQYEGNHEDAYSYKLDGDMFVLTEEYVDPRSRLDIQYISHKELPMSNDICYFIQCKIGYESDSVEYWLDIEVILVKTPYGYALRKINSK